jgi:hypothetical protein
MTVPAPNSSSSTLVVKRGASELLRIEEDDTLTFCTPPHVCSMILYSANGDPLLPLNNERIDFDALLFTHTAPHDDMPRTLDVTFTADGMIQGPFRYYLAF